MRNSNIPFHRHTLLFISIGKLLNSTSMAREVTSSALEAQPGPSADEVGDDTKPAVVPYDEFGFAASEFEVVNEESNSNRPFHYTLTMSGGWGAFAGDFFAGHHPGLSLQGAFRFSAGERYWVNLLYRNQADGTNKTPFYDFDLDDTIIITYAKRMAEYSMMFGERLNPNGSPHTIFTAEVGVTYMRRKQTASSPGLHSQSGADGDLGLASQLGALLVVGDNWLVDLQFRTGLKLALFDDDAGGASFSIHAGFGRVWW